MKSLFSITNKVYKISVLENRIYHNIKTQISSDLLLELELFDFELHGIDSNLQAIVHNIYHKKKLKSYDNDDA